MNATKYPSKIKMLVLLIAIITSFSFSSCSIESNAIEAVPKASEKEIYLEAIRLNSIPGSGSDYPDKINEYLLNKAEEMNLYAEIDEVGNVIIEKPASADMMTTTTTILEAPTFTLTHPGSMKIDFDADKLGIDDASLMPARNLGIASILSILKTSESSGPIKAIFTCSDYSSTASKTSLSDVTKDASFLIGFSGVDGYAVYNESASYHLLTSNKQIETAPPKSRYAYVIAASKYPQDISSNITPLKEISNILTIAKTGGLYFELASIETNSTPLIPPSEASAIILVDEYEKKRFRSLFNELSKEYLSSLPEKYSDVSLELIETKIPSQVLTDNETDMVVAYLYGLFNNGNIPESTEILPISISNISLNDNNFSCTFSISGNDETVKQIVSAHAGISQFTGMDVVQSADIIGYQTDDDNQLLHELSESMKKITGEKPETKSILEANELGTIVENNQKIIPASLGWEIMHNEDSSQYVSLSDIAIPANTVIHFLATMDKQLLYG